MERRRDNDAANLNSAHVAPSTSVKEPIANLALSNVLRAPVAALSKTMAVELAPARIRVNNIMAGKIATDRMRAVDRAAAHRMGVSLAEAEARTVASIPLGRYGTADELGRVAAWLLSDSASYITGTSVQVDGGLVQCVM